MSATSATGFDLADPRVTVRECSSCHSPVSGRFEGRVVSLSCGYCGTEDTIERAPEPTSEERGESAYRGKERPREGARRPPITMDLTIPPPGFTGKEPVETIRAAWLSAKAAPVPDDGHERDLRDYQVTWLACLESAQRLRARDAVRARAVLEAALDLVEQPSYRALVLARLARLAVQAKSAELAKGWLDRVPESRKRRSRRGRQERRLAAWASARSRLSTVSQRGHENER